MDKQKRKDIIEWILCIVAAFVLALIIRTFVFEMVVVKQTSMFPNLKETDKVGVFKLSYLSDTPERGDIVIIKIEKNKNYIKRVIALSGETIEIRENTVYINNEALKEDYISDELIYDDFGPVTINDGCIFVMGDNRPSSIDSRKEEVGQIPYSRIIGKAIFRLKPFEFYGF